MLLGCGGRRGADDRDSGCEDGGEGLWGNGAFVSAEAPEFRKENIITTDLTRTSYFIRIRVFHGYLCIGNRLPKRAQRLQGHDDVSPLRRITLVGYAASSSQPNLYEI